MKCTKHGFYCCPHCADEKQLKKAGDRQRELNEITEKFIPTRYEQLNGFRRYY